MIIKRTPQSRVASGFVASYLENLHSKTIDLGLERVSSRGASWRSETSAILCLPLRVLMAKAPRRTLESILMAAAGYKVGVYSSPHLVRYTERVRVQGSGIAGIGPHWPFAEIESARGDISLTHFEYGTPRRCGCSSRHNSDVK